LFLMKRQYRWPRPVSEQLQIGTIKKYIETRDIANGESFDNNQINTMVEYLQRGTTKILEIVLCEVYNDNEMARDINRRSIQLSNRETYYPFTIPIKVLYRSRDINNRVYNSPSIVRKERISLEQSRQAQILAITLPQFQRLLRENPQEARREVRVALAIRRRTLREQQQGTIQEQARAQREDPEAQQRLLENWPVEITQRVYDPNEETENPNPLKYVNDQILLHKPLTSYVWPGMCQICFTDDREGLCRVNCEAGHIFHCECVNSWRNTRKTNTYYEHGWHNDCPVCHEEIDSMVMVTPAVAEKLPSSFGRRRRGNLLKVVESEIKYLNSI